MNPKSFFRIISASALALVIAACSGGADPDPVITPPTVDPDPDPSTGGYEDLVLNSLTEKEINGTAIKSASNLAGLIKDSKTGKGIKGVPVTDGYTYTQTDENGVYQMTRNPKARKVYYTTPAEYEIFLDSRRRQPCFFSTGIMASSKSYRVDFTLTPLAAAEEEFTLVAVGDPQCSVQGEALRYVNETIADITKTCASYQNVYAVTLGDIIFDSNNLWSTMQTSMSNVKSSGKYIPFFQCIGNHDHNSLAEDTADNDDDDYRATQKYVETFGPTDYSFDRGKAHIIVMDDIMVTSTKTSSKSNGKTWEYNGGISDAQMTWLTEDLSNVDDKGEKLVILCMHIPMRGGSSSGGSNINKTQHYADILKALTPFKEAHLFIGHTHYPQNYIHTGYKSAGGQPIYEHVHQAACGAWWSCNSSVIGAPNGYSIYSVKEAGIQDWVNKATGKEASYQMRIYDGNQIYTGSKKYALNWFTVNQTAGSAGITVKGNTNFKGCFVAEIWDDDDTNWKVELWQNGNKVGDFKRVANGQSANVCVAAYYFNELGKNTTTWSSTTASHYWYCAAPDGKAPADVTGWEVRATQTIPTSGKTKTYTRNDMTKNYSEF
ncbi:MAG: calcineurin-like phosphoesterase C-terminal domain-containing protein [Candidatus Cryptobacteroides sp.]